MPRKDRETYNEYMREKMLERYHDRRSQALFYLGGVCVRCGTDQDLEFDHINSNDKSFSISKLWSVSHIKFAQELDKCQILCNSCHKKKTKLHRDYRRAIR